MSLMESHIPNGMQDDARGWQFFTIRLLHCVYLLMKVQEGGCEMEKERLKKRLKKQMDFCLEIDKEKRIGRQTYRSDAIQKENDAEHAWHMAVMTLLLSEYANDKIDVLRTISMLLIHDLVEIYAGDTYAYDEEAKKTQRQREVNAAEKLFSMLPKDQETFMRNLWDEFEEGATAESKFAHTMDNIQPTMLNAATKGKGWVEKNAQLSKILQRNQHTGEGSEVLWNYSLQNYIMPNVENGKITDDRTE